MRAILAAAVFALMTAEGMRVTPRDLGVAWRSPRKLARGVVAVVVMVPLVALLVTTLLSPSMPVTVALAFLAAAPLAPFVLTKLARSGEDFRLAASLHVALAALSIFSAPIVVTLLGRALALPPVAPGPIAGQVLVSQLVPFGIGTAVRRAAPSFAVSARKLLEAVGLVVLLVILVLVFVRGRGAFGELDARDYLALTLFCVLALATGHFLAEREDERSIYALEAAARNPGIALLMATSSFGPVRGAVLLPYLGVFIVVSSLYSVLRRRRTAARRNDTSGAPHSPSA